MPHIPKHRELYDDSNPSDPRGPKPKPTPTPTPTPAPTYEAGTYVDPDGDGKYQLVYADGETLGAKLFWDTNGTPVIKGQPAPWDDSGTRDDKDDGIDPFDVNPTTGGTDEDDYWDFLEDGSIFDYETPPLSQLESFKEWQSSVSRDRFSDEYSLQRYPGQTFLGMGPLATPEWFPTSYQAYKYSMPSQNASAGNITLAIDSIQESYGEDFANLLLTLDSIGGGGWDAVVGEIDWDAVAAAGELPFDINTVLEDTSYLVDLETYQPNGESLAEQSWFTPEKKEILNKYFEGMQNVFAGDVGTTIKSQTWASAKKSLALGVDPDKVFAELNTLSDTPHAEWEDMPFTIGYDTVKSEGPQVVFDTINAEYGLEKYQEFTADLEQARSEDPDAFAEMYGFLPLQDKLTYLHGLHEAGGLDKDTYENLYVQEVNANYDPVENPEALKFVEINDKIYLDNSGAGDTDLRTDLMTPQFYPKSDDPLDVNQFYQRIGNEVANGRSDDFRPDSSVWDFLDPIMTIAAIFTPLVGLVYTAAKGLSGETLHASDWLRAIPGAIDQFNTISNDLAFKGFGSGTQIPKTIGEAIPSLKGTMAGGVKIVYGSNAAAAAAEGIKLNDEDGFSLGIGDLIKVGSVVLGGSGGSTSAVQQGCILSLKTAMSDAGITLPEGAFEVNDDGSFAGIDGNTIEFAEALEGILDTYRQEDPEAFAVAITDPEVDPLIAETIGSAVYDGAKYLVAVMQAQAEEGSLTNPLAGAAFKGTAYGDLLETVDRAVLATVLSTGGNILNQLNAVFMMGETHPENTKLAEVSQYLLGMADEASPQSLKDSATKLQEFQAKFEDKTYFEQKTKEEVINSGSYKALKLSLDNAVDNGSLTAERRDELLANTIDKRKR